MMRIELRVEADEHEHTITLETDQSVSRQQAMLIACDAMNGLIAQQEPF
jgi:hypothetical protein